MSDPVEAIYAELDTTAAPPSPAPEISFAPTIPPDLVLELATIVAETRPRPTPDLIIADSSSATTSSTEQSPATKSSDGISTAVPANEPSSVESADKSATDRSADKSSDDKSAAESSSDKSADKSSDDKSTAESSTDKSADRSTDAQTTRASRRPSATVFPPLRAEPAQAVPRRTAVARPTKPREPGRERVEASRLLRNVNTVMTASLLPGETPRSEQPKSDASDASITEPVARKLLADLATALDNRPGPDGRPLTSRQRLELLRDAREQLEDYIDTTELSPAALDQYLPFLDTFAVKEQLLLVMAIAESVRAGLGLDSARAGLAAPTVELAELYRKLDLLELVLDELGKTATVTTRVQAKEFTDITNSVLAGSGLPANVTGGYFSLLAGAVYMRGLLNAAKFVIMTGQVIDPKSKYSRGEKAVIVANLPTKLAEGLFASGSLISAVASRISGDTAGALSAISKYAVLGRNLVWTGSTIQLLSGLINLTLVAVTDRRFRRTYLTDVLYGGTGTLAPIGTFGKAVADRALQRQFGRTATQLAGEAAAAAAGLEAGALGEAEASAARLLLRQIGRHALASRALAVAGPASYYLAIAELPIQSFTFGFAANDRLNVRSGLQTVFTRLQYVLGGISQDALNLQDILESPRLGPVLGVSHARILHDAITTQLASFAAEHDGPRVPGARIPLPLLGARIRQVQAELRGVDRNDPRSVLTGVRRVFAAVRQLFADQELLYRDELRRIDKASLFELNTATTDPPKP